jgi:hypothetical protein
MSPEDFTHGPKQDHPEIASDPEAAQPAQQKTIKSLLDAITNKTTHFTSPYDYDGKKSISTHRPGESVCAATLERFEKGVSSDHPDCVGQVTRSTYDGGIDKVVWENYFIIDIPDGLHIEKRSHSQDSDNYLKVGASWEQFIGSIAALREDIRSIKESEPIENELGLTFVSEKEANDLLAFIDPLEPFSDN